MYLLSLSLANFRNYIRLALDIPRQVTVLQGANAQGKTNFLESIYYLSAARSPYATSDIQLVNWLAKEDDLPHMRIMAEVARKDAQTRIEITLAQDNSASSYRKHIRINGVPKRVVDLLGQVNTVLFVPQDIALIDGAPSERRRYLNITLCQVDPVYCRTLRGYMRVLEQRNHLLRSLRDRGGARDQLDYWDIELAKDGAQIIARRQQAVLELETLAQSIHTDLSGGRERLRLRYVPTFDAGQPQRDEQQMLLDLDLPPPVSIPQDVETVYGAFLEILRNSRRQEIQRGMTLTGPHRDDLRFLDGQIDLHMYGSRGQQRTAVLALKLAEVSWMAKTTGEQPILLLDDVMSELDFQRRRYLCEQIDQVEQAIITTTDMDALAPDLVQRSNLYRVSQGRLEPYRPQ
jgi:DNA replication and repair protein RecF